MNVFSLRRILVLLILITVTSCMVGPQGMYYKPSYPDSFATIEGGWCYGAAGPPAVIKLPIGNGIIVKARLNPDEHDRTRLRLIVKIPRDSSVQFVTNEIRLTDPNSGKEWRIESTNIELMQGPAIPVPAIAVINFDEIGPTKPPYVPEDVSWKDFHVRIPFSIINYYPRHIRIILPHIIANDKEYEIPSIEFVEGEEANKINRKWWPYKTKEKEDGSWTNVNDFTVGGGVTSGYIDNKFGGNIMVSFTPSTKWRFLSNVIRVEDLDTGEEHHASFENIFAHFSLTVSFTAPIFNKVSNIATTASLDIAISEKPHESIVVQLPDIIVNGKKIHLKPITFKKDSAFGLIPFNC